MSGKPENASVKIPKAPGGGVEQKTNADPWKIAKGKSPYAK